MARNLLNSTKVIKIRDHSAASTAAVTSDIVDMAGFSGIMFVTSFGTANATNSIKVQGNATNTTAGMADIEGTGLASGASDEDVIAEIHKPQQRFLQVVATRGASSTLESIWAILYGGSSNAARNSVSGTQVAELSVSPPAGTA